MMEQSMEQIAAFPEELRDLVTRLGYKANWNFTLRDVDRGQGEAFHGCHPRWPHIARAWVTFATGSVEPRRI